MLSREALRRSARYDVDVVLVTWNSRRYLPRLVETLAMQKGVKIRLHLVDNGSCDGSADWMAQHGNPATLIRNDTNRGFAEACNQGVAAGEQSFVQLLNHDVTLRPDYCRKLCDALSRHPRVGSATGKILQEGSFPPTLDSTGHIVHRSGLAFNRGEGELDSGQFDQLTDVFGVTAAAAMYRRAALDDVAIRGEFLPSSFFAYVEDIDLDFRLRWRGWSAIYEPTAVGYHARSSGGAKGSKWIEDNVRKNHILLIAREFDTTWLRRHSGEILGPMIKEAYHQLRRPRRLAYLRLAATQLPASLHARRHIRTRRMVSPHEVHQWLVPTNGSWLPYRWVHGPVSRVTGKGVSVIIVCRNQDAHLSAAIGSVLRQTVAPREIIVVDNGSEDQTRHVAAEFRDSIRYVYTARGVSAAAKNVGLMAATGEYIVLLEATSRLEPLFLQRTLRVFERAGDRRLAGVYSQIAHAKNANNVTEYPEFDGMRLMRREYQGAVPVLRSTALLAHRFDTGVSEGSEDWTTWMRLFARGYQFRLLNEPLVTTETKVVLNPIWDTGVNAWQRVRDLASIEPGLLLSHPLAIAEIITDVWSNKAPGSVTSRHAKTSGGGKTRI